MANLRLSAKGDKYLEEIRAELDIDRPSALRLAFAKGIASETRPNEEKRPMPTREFPSSVIAKGKEMTLIKHLMINKLRRKIEEEEVENYILIFVEHGLEEMYKEIQQISDADNYLFYLLDKHQIG